MNQYFKNILIPVDFTGNTEIAVRKALELAEENSLIHLLYVHNNESADPFSAIYELTLNTSESYLVAVEGKLNQWKKNIYQSLQTVTVSVSMVTEKSVQEAVVETAKKLAIDLIIIAKRSHHSWLPFLNTINPSEVAKLSGVTVLTVKSWEAHNKVRIMVVPVTNDNALHKLGIIYAICRKFPVKIYLATFAINEEKQAKFCTKAFLQIYQILKGGKCQVAYTVLSSNNKARAILRYAEKLNADILLVDPVDETRIGWPNKHISDILPEHSKLQVWAV